MKTKNIVLCNLKLQSLFFGFFVILLFFTASILFSGCGKSSQKQITVPQKPSKPRQKMPEYVPPPEPPKYVYKGGMYRDPLIPLTGSGAGASYTRPTVSGEDSFTSEKIATLALKGIFKDSRGNELALISDGSGNVYTLKGRKVFDRKNKLIAGVSGVIQQKGVVLFTKDIKVELKLKKDKQEDKKK